MIRRVLSASAAILAVALLTGASVSPVAPNPDPVRAAEYWLDEYGIRDAWSTTRGAGVRIAIIDTGVARGPVEFEGAVVGGTDVSGIGSSDGRTPVGAVDANHGSWVASLAGARGTGASTGMIGVAPQAELLAVSVGFGSSAQVPFADQIAEAIRWSVDNGADVINLSLTTNTPDWDKSWDDAFLYAFENDVVVVVAAGNRGSGTSRVGAPATIPGVLTVAGVDTAGQSERRGVHAGHHAGRVCTEREPRRRLRRRAARAVERHQRCGADRGGNRRSGAGGAPRHGREQRHQPDHRDGASTGGRDRAGRPAALRRGIGGCRSGGVGIRAVGDVEPDGQPHRLDPSVPARGQRPGAGAYRGACRDRTAPSG